MGGEGCSELKEVVELMSWSRLELEDDPSGCAGRQVSP